MITIQTLIKRAFPVMPVMVINRLEDAVPLARALSAGGIDVFEITLRSDCALAAISAIKQALPEAITGAGTVCTPQQLELAKQAGADFAVSPGLTEELAEAASAHVYPLVPDASSDFDVPADVTNKISAAVAKHRFPLIPGVCTPSEVMRAKQFGFELLKFFPAAQSGGVGMLKAFAGPFSDLKFCPTGGISESNAGEYLSLPNVACVGGSWLCPNALVERQDWEGITALARATAALTTSG